MSVLTRYSWPGNVRELENVIYRSAVIAQGDAILVKDLPAEIRSAVGSSTDLPDAATAGVPSETASGTSGAAPSLTATLDALFEQLQTRGEPILPQLERELAARAILAAEGDDAKAAKMLGVTAAALQKLKRTE
jgi:two-component system nitrogen regulation response regulator GlnG